MDLSFVSLWEERGARAACSRLARSIDEVVEEAIAIQQIPAPTFAEAERAGYVRGRFEEMGLDSISIDDVGNVYGRVPGREIGPALAVTAHLDTVFGAETALTVQRREGIVQGAGIGDNSMGVAGLLALASALREEPFQRDVWFVANVGEEGLGNLNGMWAAMGRLQGTIGAIIVLEGGAYGTIIHQGIGVQRRRLIVETEGGHAWSDFGTPSAIHELCRIGSQIRALGVPRKPRSSYNLGMIEGGTSINTIAARASALLDLRSESLDGLRALARRVDEILARARQEGVRVISEQIGERPAGGIPKTHPLVRGAVASLAHLDDEPPRLRAASTDANVPLAMGIPAVCIGLTIGHNAHRLDEYIEVPPLANGLQHCYHVMLVAQALLMGAEGE